MQGKVIIPVIIALIINNIKCANILGMFNCPSKSLHLAGVIVAEILAEKGHNVTLVTAYKMSEAPKNFQHIFLSEVGTIFDEDSANLYEFNLHPYHQVYAYNWLGILIANKTYNDPEFKQLLKSKPQFDLVILENILTDSLLYIAEYFDAPLMLYLSTDACTWSNQIVGNPAPPSYVPDILLAYSSDMTFFERLDNALIQVLNQLAQNYVALSYHDQIVKEHFPGAPDISEYYHKASVILVNSDVSVGEPKPKVPGMIDIGGYHIRPSKGLPKDLEDIITNAEHGVIYFSMGSNLKSNQLPKKNLQILLKVFASLNETILWKFEDEQLPERPYNVVIRKWLPQNEILAHKNVKLFITHGGFHSILETIYHGVPCVVLPVFVDQLKNAVTATKLGYAEWIKFEDFTLNTFETAVKQLLHNPRYTKIAKERSSIMHDKPIAQEDTLAFWVDYVIKHKGADHLKVASLKLTWYQYLLLDVIAFILICLLLSMIMFKYLFTRLIGAFGKKELKEKKA